MTSDLYEGLSTEQRAIVDSGAKTIVVVAGPGTGKSSRGIMRRIARQLSDGVSPRSIKLLSFTRVAAQDLKEKVQELEVPGAEDIDASTVHSMCLKYLYAENLLQQYRRSDRFMFEHEKDLMLYDTDSENVRINQLRKTLREFESDWTIDEDSYRGHKIPSSEETDFQAAITSWMIDHKSMIIGEVVPLAVQMLKRQPSHEIFPDMDHLIVDEYQDLNFLEQRFLDTISGSLSSLLLVGDDDQSIYSFKHANPDRIRELSRTEEDDIDIITMVECRRSPAPIVQLGNRLMAHAPARAKDAMTFDATREGYVANVSWQNLDDEVAGITSAIAVATTIREIEPGDILVLVPNRKIGRMMIDRLAELEIPSQGFFDQSVFKGNETARKAMALIDLCVDESDPLAWRVMWGQGASKGSAAAYRSLSIHAKENRVSPLNIIRNEPYSKTASKRHKRLYSIFMQVRAQLEAIDKTDPHSVISGIRKLHADESQLGEFLSVCDEVLATLDEDETLAGFARKLRAEFSFSNVPEESDKVRVMTFHKSKGLTAKSVFVCGLVEGLIPNLSDCESGDDVIAAVDEGRRLLYVAITRTASELVLSRFGLVDNGIGKSMGLQPSGNYRAGNRPFPVASSRYLAELMPSLSLTIGGTQFDREYNELPPPTN